MTAFGVDDLAAATRAAPVRLRDELIPPPPDEARENAAPCQTCGRVKTWHRSARCRPCGGWVTRIDAASVTWGMLVLYGPWWLEVTGVASTTDTAGEPVRRIALSDGTAVTLTPDAAVMIATSTQRTAA